MDQPDDCHLVGVVFLDSVSREGWIFLMTCVENVFPNIYFKHDWPMP